MKTKSERLANEISQKYFLKQYIFSDVYVRDNSQEYEFCDCLIEFDDSYVVVQIKERNNNNQGGSTNKWFTKVLKKAKQQLRDTFEYFNNKENLIFSKSNDLIIDRNKKIIPVIIFLNHEINKYERIIESKLLNSNINVFSYNDFKIMLDTIKMPYDILNYLKFREILKNTGDPNIVIDDINEEMTMLFKPRDEKDYSEWFLSRTYYKKILKNNLNEENIQFYNHILSELNKIIGYNRDSFIEGLLKVDYSSADRISKNWLKLIELVKEEKIVEPFKVVVDNSIYLFLVRPSNMEIERFNHYLELVLVRCRYKYNVEIAHIIAFVNVSEDQYCVELAKSNLETDIRYNELVEQVKEAYDEN